MGEESRKHFQQIANQYDKWKKKNAYYYSQLKRLFSSFIPPGSDVLEIGCGTGDILNSVNPRKGLGVDISPRMLDIAKAKYPHLSFTVCEAENLKVEGKYDYVIMSDLIEHLSDVWKAIGELKKVTNPQTRLIISFINPFWEPLLMLGERLGLKMPEGAHNRLLSEDIINLLALHDFTVEDKGYRVLIPKNIPGISDFLNRYAPHIPLLRNYCFVQYLIARPTVAKVKGRGLSSSIIIPCFNEAANIKSCINRVPACGKPTEIIVVDDGSVDGTSRVVQEMRSECKNLRIISYSPNRGKGYAVRKGFEAASGDVLMILDADMAVPPEELPRFLLPLEEGKAEVVNGTRMVYPMEGQAMRQLHLWGNKIFSIIFTWLVGQRLTDTLCGTKVILKKDFERMKMGRCPWGDFDILLGVAKLGLKMVEMPVHYKTRKAGKSKMKTFRHGLVLLGMCAYGFKELKLKKWFGKGKFS